mmetsp:Transcript_6900/g.22669  ORF Transcript_6900/g.22669 Transcript_6900/m.22669 type:complete len:246 (-) Transcript_6900:100-837(-)
MRSSTDHLSNAQFESVLASPAEVSAILQSHDGTRLDEAHLLMMALVQQMEAPRLQVVSGRGPTESWDEVAAARLDPIFKEFRSIFTEQATARFSLKGTPNEHVLLCIKMSPFVDISTDGPFGKRATQELMDAVYTRALRARQQDMLSQVTAFAASASASAASASTSTASPTSAASAASAGGGALPTATPATAALCAAGKKRQKIGALASSMHAVSKAIVVSHVETTLADEIDAYGKIRAVVDQAE